MVLTPEMEAQLGQIYGVNNAALNPDTEAKLAQIYGVNLQNSIPAEQSSAFSGALSDIGRNTKRSIKDSIISTSDALYEPIDNSNVPASMQTLNTAVRGLGKAGNALGGAYGLLASPVQGAMTASVENSGLIPAARTAIKNYLVPNDPRFTDRSLSPQEENQLAQEIGGNLTNAAFLGAGGVAGKQLHGGVTKKPLYNPITETIIPAVKKADIASQKLPGILGKTDSGVSVNASLGGVPESIATILKGIKNRVTGLSAYSPEELDSILVSQHENTGNLYKAVDATGASLKPQTAKILNQEILSSIQDLQINPVASPKTVGAVKELYNRITVGKTNPITGEVTQAPLTVSELDGYRKLLNNISGEDAVVANKVRDTIDNSLQKMTTQDFVGGGADAPKLLFEARASAAKGFKMEQLADMIKKADGDERAIVSGFKKFTDKKGWERGFDKDEQQAIKDVAKRGTGQSIERGLGTFGFDLGRAKNVALPYFLAGEAVRGGAAAITPMGVPLAIGGTVLRQTGKLAARGKAKRAFDLVKERK